MLYDILALLYFSCFLAAGLLISRTVFYREGILTRFWLGGVCSLVLLLWLPALFSFVLGFTLASQLLALLAALLIATAVYIPNRKKCPATGTAISGNLLRPLLFTLLPLAFIGCFLFCTHTIVNKGGNLYVGQSTYGDLSMHLGFITSISVQETFPPYYSICPDTPVGYPFLCDSISSTFYTLGAGLRFSAMLPSIFAYILVILGVWAFFEKWLGSPRKTALATWLFFVGGGFGFAYFFDLAQKQPDRFSSLFTAFYETPTNYTEYGLRWVNTICDMLIPQRATLFGWALLFPALYFLLHLAFQSKGKSLLENLSTIIPLGLLAGALPLVHTHSFLALGLVSTYYFLRSLLKREGKTQILSYLCYAAMAVMLAAPQLMLFTFRQSGSFLTINLNWANNTDSFLWFYIKNWGLLFLLLPVALPCVSRRSRSIWCGILLLWLLSEIIQFQPNSYDNNKLLFVVFAFHCGIIADLLVSAYERFLSLADLTRGMRVGAGILSVLILLSLFTSGVLTIGRECNSSYQLIDEEETAAAVYISENTAPDATFLTYNNHNNAVAVLTGRNIVCGSGSFLYFHGIDYSDRENALRPLFEEPEANLPIYQEAYSIDYVYVGPYEIYNYIVDIDYFDANFRIVYENDGVTIYDLSQAP